ncbi:alpha-amylase [Elysia marginata]|uniref:Alpha-amylase n=1 Tax=Elysia marginata TaxID=1093978 RepID=A0AAV4H6K8_9GAST|nr:alpha-amylase [Elysia marginata]
MFHLGFAIALCGIVATFSASIYKKQDDFQDTVIFLKKQTNYGQKVFIRGGVGGGQGCFSHGGPKKDPCAIRIRHLGLDMDIPQRERLACWDEYLSWTGAEPCQTQDAYGTPMQWTTSDQSKNYFHRLNMYVLAFYLELLTLK